MNTDILLACVGVFFGELYGNFVGGGSLVTQVFLQNIIGFDVKQAIALDNAAVLGSEIGLLLMLLRKQKIESWMWLIVIVSLFGALFGARLLSLIPLNIMEGIFTVAVIGFVIKNLFFPSKPLQEQGFVPNPRGLLLLCLASFAIATYNTFLSIGDFIVGLLVLTSIFHFPYQRALFLLTFGFVFARALGTVEYFRLGLIQIDFYIPMFFSAMLSGFIAGYLVERIHSDILNTILKYMSVALALYLALQIFV